MWEYLLRPLGVAEPPGTIAAAVEAFRAARARRERELGVAVPKEPGRTVLARLRAAGLA